MFLLRIQMSDNPTFVYLLLFKKYMSTKEHNQMKERKMLEIVYHYIIMYNHLLKMH